MPANGTANLKPFKKGQSGNPSGRPKGHADVRALARTYTADAIHALVKVVNKGKNESARTTAALGLLDRGWGRPLQQVEVKRSPLDGLTTAQLVEYLEAIDAALQIAGEQPEALEMALLEAPSEGNA